MKSRKIENCESSWYAGEPPESGYYIAQLIGEPNRPVGMWYDADARQWNKDTGKYGVYAWTAMPINLIVSVWSYRKKMGIEDYER